MTFRSGQDHARTIAAIAISATSSFKTRVKPLQFYAGVGGSEFVLIVNSVPLAQSRELGDAPAHEGYAQTDLVGGHRALQITSLSRGGDRGAAPPAQCAAQKIDEAARL